MYTDSIYILRQSKDLEEKELDYSECSTGICPQGQAH